MRIDTIAMRWLGGLLLLVSVAIPAAALDLEYVDSALWTRDRDCEARGDTLLTALEYGLQVWDMGDPTQPALLGDLYLGGKRAHSLDSHGDLVAVASSAGGLYLIDIADPSAPALVGSVASGLGDSPDVTLVERDGTLFAYTAGSINNGLRLYDLTNPALPLLRGTLAASGLRSVAERGDLVLALSLGGHLRSVEVSDPDHLVLLDQLDLVGSNFTNVTMGDSIAVVAGATAGFFVIDIADSTNLGVITQVVPAVNPFYPSLSVKEVVLDGSLLYVAADQAGPLVYDMTDPANPLLVAYDPILDTGLPAPYGEFFNGDLDAANGRLYLSSWKPEAPGTLIFDLTGSDPLFLGRTPATDFTRFAAISGDMFFGCSGEAGLFGFQLVAGQLEARGRLALDEMYGAEAHGLLVYAASTNQGLVISDWSNPLAPQVLGSLDVGQARSLTVRDDVAYIAAYTDGLFAVDVSDPSAPTLLDSATVAGISSARLDVAGVLAATADLNDGANFWNVENPANIVWLGNYDVVPRVLDVKLFGQLAYVAVDGDSIHVVSLADPLNPVKLAEVGPRNPTGLELTGQRLLVSAKAASPQPGGIFAYLLTNPLSPSEIYHYYTTGTALGMTSRDGLMLVADDSALTLLSMGTTGAGDTPLAATASLAAWPNPFNPRTDLRFSLSAEARGALDVFDVAGRHLRRLAEGSFAAGDHQFVWDGTDDTGRPLPSGVYFARFAAQSAAGDALAATRKLVLLR